MGKSKKPATPEVEDLLKEIKQQKEVIRHLEREIKKQARPSSKGEKKRQDKLIEEDFDTKDLCPLCQKGRLVKTSLGVRTIEGCTVGCGYRKVIKNDKV